MFHISIFLTTSTLQDVVLHLKIALVQHSETLLQHLQTLLQHLETLLQRLLDGKEWVSEWNG